MAGAGYMAIMYLADREVVILRGVPKIGSNGLPYTSGDIVKNRRHVDLGYEFAVVLGVGDSSASAKSQGQMYYNAVSEMHRKDTGATQFWDEEDSQLDDERESE